MSVKVKFEKNRWRVVDNDGAVINDKKGKPSDGGGYRSGVKAKSQARKLNSKEESVTI